MPRIPHFKIPLPVFKPTRVSWTHKRRRQDYLDNPKVKFPIYSRLPESWRKEFEEPMPIIHQYLEEGERRPQFPGLWKLDKSGQPQPVVNTPIKVWYPPASNEGIWAGEGVISGQRYARGGDKKSRRYKKLWNPMLMRRTFYSEILDEDITTTFTSRALDLIDAAFGFDYFILQTQTKVLQKFGGSVKRRMLLKLARKDTDLYPEDTEKRDRIFNKYKKYVIPEEEAEWVGLSLYDVMHKQWNKEKAAGVHDPVPLLEVYSQQLRDKLRIEAEPASDGDSSHKEESVAVFDMGKLQKPVTT